jgi:acetyl-CoA/propionyl-CoA carboxylase, biotin carboxylase, biotin carboxyl carrier protein
VADDLLTPRQVAAELGVTARTVQRWIASGRLAAIRVGGRERVSRSSLAAVTSARVEDSPLPGRIHTLLIANRGEIVGRIARTARRLGIRPVGVATTDDRRPDEVGELRIIPDYLDGDAIVAAAVALDADAVHPGYGFLSESSAFAGAVTAAGLVWVGPPSTAIAAMGDKGAARRKAGELGVPVVPGTDGNSQADDDLEAEASRIGLPLLVKPAAGGGGKGMRVVRELAELPEALAASRREARRAFGDDRLILERYLEGPRHVEIQVLFDRFGHGVHLGERDCSAQRRSQKIVEEAPGPSVTDDLRRRMGEAALQLAAGVGYVGAGTVEFLLTDAAEFFFLEMNTRLQVEHAVTEMVTGRDLVEDQLRIAEGRPLGIARHDVQLAGHAIEARLYAEDPDAGFLPASGRIVELELPSGSGVRVDAGIRAGDLVSDRYDPMLAKVIAAGRTRDEAVGRLRQALVQTRVLGVRTNLRFLRWFLAQPVALAGEIRTDTIAELDIPPAAVPADSDWRAAGAALLAEGPYGAGPWSAGWRPNGPAAVRLRAGDVERRVELVPDQASTARAILSGGKAYVDVEGQSVEIALAMPPTIEEAVRHAANAEGQATLVAPMPGRVIAVRAREGDTVPEHAAVVVIEAMKMEHAVTAPFAGRLTRVLVRQGQQVQRGDLLAEMTAEGHL